MGYRSRIIFDKREWLVIDVVEYNGVKYSYIIEDISEQLDNLENVEDFEGKLTAEFIYELPNGSYANVIDKQLIDTLSGLVVLKNTSCEKL